MCWLCRREIEASTGSKDRGSIHRPALCRIISFSQPQDQDEATPSSTCPVSISGIGCRLPSSTLWGGVTFVVPYERDHSIEHSPTHQVNLRIIQDPVYCPASQKWTFRVHADCWDLLECRAEQSGDIQSCALSWCKALVSLNWNFTPFTPGMGRYDLPKLLLTSDPSPTGRAKSPKNHRNRNTKLGMQRLVSFEDLAPELGLTNSREEAIPLSRLNLGLYALPEKTSLQFRSSSSSTRDIFSDLPHEILQQIILYTRTTDLLNFRLASRAVAYVSRLEGLPRPFWFSRFLPGFELSFALPVEVDKTRDIDWRGLYFLVRKALNSTEARATGTPESEGALARLARRKYWWGRFAEVSSLWRDFGSQASLEGEPFSWPSSLIPSSKGAGSESEEQSNGKPGPKGSPCAAAAAAQLTRGDDAQRYHSTVSTTIPSSSAIASVVISTVRLCGQSYISGVRFFYRHETAPKSLGYVFEHSETIVRLGEGAIFCGFDVRLDADAVQSLRVVYRTESGEYHRSSWAGDVNPTTSLGIQSTAALIRWVECKNPCRLAASFDVSEERLFGPVFFLLYERKEIRAKQ